MALPNLAKASLRFSLPTPDALRSLLSDPYVNVNDQLFADLLFSGAPDLSWVQGRSRTGQGSWTQSGAALSDADVSVFHVALARRIDSLGTDARWGHIALRTLRNERALKAALAFAKRVSVAREAL